MSKLFFTSDHHFGHSNIIKYEALARVDEWGVMFRSVEQMDEFLIARWNDVVGVDDLVYHLGDMSFKQTNLYSVLPRLNGRKILVVGNHDPYFKNMYSEVVRENKTGALNAKNAGFESVHTELEIELKGIGRVKMSHYPYAPLKPEDELYTRYLELRPKPTGEALLLHGHVHSQWNSKKQRGQPLMINVGVDGWGLRPLSEQDLKAVFEAYQE